MIQIIYKKQHGSFLPTLNELRLLILTLKIQTAYTNAAVSLVCHLKSLDNQREQRFLLVGWCYNDWAKQDFV